MKFTLTSQDIALQATSLVNFHKHFAHFFQTKTRCIADAALDYLKGLLTVNTKKLWQKWNDKLTQLISKGWDILSQIPLGMKKFNTQLL